jgi:mRNA-degrading endonuclease YafQ of YafQ-DinJ toxin-antitoxin module
MEVAFKPSFVRQLKKLPTLLKEEVIEKIELFKNEASHPVLKIHKLHGDLKEYFSFSVNYRYRIVFTWEIKNKSAIFVAVGDHEVYE